MQGTWVLVTMVQIYSSHNPTVLAPDGLDFWVVGFQRVHVRNFYSQKVKPLYCKNNLDEIDSVITELKHSNIGQISDVIMSSRWR